MNGMEQKNNELTLFYSIPLNVHGSTCQLKWKEGRLHFSIQMLGEYTNRWSESAAFLRILHHLHLFPYEKIKLYNNVLDFTWKITNKEQMQQACKFLTMIFDISCGNSYNSSVMKYLCQIYLDNPETALALKNLKDTSNDPEIKHLISFLQKTLDQRDNQKETAIKFAADTDPEKKLQSLEILDKFIAFSTILKGDYDLILQIASKLILDENPEVQIKAIKVFIWLCKEERGRTKAIELVKHLVEVPDIHVGKKVTSLLHALIKNGKHQNILLDILKTNPNPQVIDSTCLFIKKLANIFERSAVEEKIFQELINQVSLLEDSNAQKYVQKVLKEASEFQQMSASLQKGYTTL